VADPAGFEALLRSRLDSYPLAPPVLAGGGRAPAAARRHLDGTAPLRDALAVVDPLELAEVLDSIVWLERPLDAPPPGTERVVTLAASPEDTFLGMGGYLLKRRGLLDCINLVCFDAAPERLETCALSARLAGVRNRLLGIPVELVKQRGSGEPPDEREEKLLRSLVVIVYSLIDRHRPGAVFAPAAFGDDPHRVLVYQAVRRIVDGGYFPRVAFHLYESFPQAGAHIDIDAFLTRAENAYVRPAQWFDDVAPVAEQKDRFAGVMQAAREQQDVLRSVAARNAILARTPHGAAERFWALRLTFGRN
jgi:hypothetical protein